MFFKSKQSAQYMVVGLGNPSAKYKDTRHNIGFAALDYIAEKAGVEVTRAKHSALCGTWQYKDQKILLLKPQTFMNLSGNAVGDAARFYKIPPQNIIVIFDDVSLPVGKMRIRLKGSAGGHNGIKSIISHIGQEFPRIKVGVGEKPHPDYDLADWVLGKFSKQDEDILKQKFEDIYNSVKLLIEQDSTKAMNLYNN